MILCQSSRLLARTAGVSNCLPTLTRDLSPNLATARRTVPLESRSSCRESARQRSALNGISSTVSIHKTFSSTTVDALFVVHAILDQLHGWIGIHLYNLLKNDNFLLHASFVLKTFYYQ